MEAERRGVIAGAVGASPLRRAPTPVDTPRTPQRKPDAGVAPAVALDLSSLDGEGPAGSPLRAAQAGTLEARRDMRRRAYEALKSELKAAA